MKPAKAVIHELPGDVTKIRITSPRIKNWTPGQHVFLSIPGLGLGQSHPATILSIPSSHDNDLVFILRAYRGFTRRLLTSAQSSTADLLQKTQEEEQTVQIEGRMCSLIGGPYGGSHSDFAAFDTVLLIAGSTGVTFTLPILLDIAQRSQNHALPVRRVIFAWVIKKTSCTEWVADELQRAMKTLSSAGIEIEVQLFVTCDIEPAEAFEKKAGCKCSVSEGPCCCTRVQDTSDAITSTEKPTAGTPLSFPLLPSHQVGLRLNPFCGIYWIMPGGKPVLQSVDL